MERREKSVDGPRDAEKSRTDLACNSLLQPDHCVDRTCAASRPRGATTRRQFRVMACNESRDVLRIWARVTSWPWSFPSAKLPLRVSYRPRGDPSNGRRSRDATVMASENGGISRRQRRLDRSTCRTWLEGRQSIMRARRLRHLRSRDVM